MKLRNIGIIGLFSLQVLSVFAQTVNVSGYVKDAASGEMLEGTNIYSKSTRHGQRTNKSGFFTLSLPAQQKIELIFSYVGYATQTRWLVLSKDTVVNVKLKQNNWRLSDVNVYAPRRDFGIENSQMSAIELPVAQVRSVPALFGEVDVMKALQRLPGVQSGGDGNAGILVRGGDYDQNLILLDGSTLYNSEHLNGFVSALNADVIDNIIFYKGAFPARYGVRLSSIIDVGMKEGDYEHYHAALSIGMLASRVHITGPILKDKTSFNLAARVSYFDAIVQPLLKSISNKPDVLKPYSHMNYYDINAKIVHKFSDKDKLSAVFYLGDDVNNSAPTDSKQQYLTYEQASDKTSTYQYNNQKSNSTDNTWGNIVSSLYWTHRTNEHFSVNTNLSYSQYKYRLQIASNIKNQKNDVTDTSPKLINMYEENSHATYHSGINDAALTIDFHYTPNQHYDIRWGTKISNQEFTPIVNVYKWTYSKIWQSTGYEEEEQLVDTVLGKKQYLKTAAAYIENDWAITNRWKINIGLRYTLFAVREKTYHSIEPRVSLRWLFTDNMAFKISYARMAQGVHLLSSSNLIMPSDLWVPVTKDIHLTKADQWALGYNYEINEGLDFSIESYYKRMDNVIEYREGVSYMTASGNWQDMVAMGKGRSYGIEMLLQKKIGKTNGWIGYTWSKSLRKFDRIGQEISGGKEFYANNDRRNNLNIVLMHRFNKHWDMSAAWTYQTGKRGILATTALYGGTLNEYDPYGNITSNNYYKGGDQRGDIPDGTMYFRKFSRFYSYSERNGFKLPDVHRLDIGINYSIKHQTGESSIGLTIYNVYNRQNISNVYIGYDNNKTVLKGICQFPFMPSLNYTYKF